MTRFQLDWEDFAARILRRYWVRWPQRQLALERAYKRKSGRAFIYICEGCGGEFKRKELHIHHIIPVISVKEGWQGIEEFTKRLFCKASGLAVLCLKCHVAVHEGDMQKRADNRKSRPLGKKAKRKK